MVATHVAVILAEETSA
jgi:hypothetical protein